MSGDFPADAYDAWKTTPPEAEEESPEDQWGFDPDREHDDAYYEDEEDDGTDAALELGDDDEVE